MISFDGVPRFWQRSYSMKRVLSSWVPAAGFANVQWCRASRRSEVGLEPGKFIAPFDVTKVSGAAEDGVEVGKNLCYRCKNGGRPQIMVFTRSTDAKVVALVKGIDAALEKNADKELRAFVNVLGESQDSATEAAKKVAEASGAKNVPFVVPNEQENGPEDYGINAKADVTVIYAVGGKVVANYAAGSAKDLNVDVAIEDIKKVLE